MQAAIRHFGCTLMIVKGIRYFARNLILLSGAGLTFSLERASRVFYGREGGDLEKH